MIWPGDADARRRSGGGERCCRRGRRVRAAVACGGPAAGLLGAGEVRQVGHLHRDHRQGGVPGRAGSPELAVHRRHERRHVTRRHRNLRTSFGTVRASKGAIIEPACGEDDAHALGLGCSRRTRGPANACMARRVQGGEGQGLGGRCQVPRNGGQSVCSPTPRIPRSGREPA